MALVEINFRPAPRNLRTFGCVGAVALSAVGAWIFFRHHAFGAPLAAPTAQVAAIALWAAAGVLVVGALAAPKGLLPAYIVLTLVALPIGYVLSHVMMAALFFGVFTPLGLVFRLIGRDALHRRFDRQGKTYWLTRPPAADVRRYFRQF